MELNICEDRQKILDEEGHILVTGGPGSGKTTIALKKALLEIEGRSDSQKKILFLSFSRAAVSRVLDSAQQWIPKEYLARLEVQTFHSFFWTVVKTHSYLLGYPKKLSILLPHDELAINHGLKEGDNGWGDWLQERDRLFVEDGRISFDYFSATALRLFSEAEDIKRLISFKYPLIIVDEAQDTDEVQWECVKLLAQNSQLLCLADLEQQIYDFRPGVSLERVSEIQDELTPCYVDLGSQNNRSPDSEILDFGNDLLAGRPKRGKYNGISRAYYQERADTRDMSIRQSVGRLKGIIQKETGNLPESIVILSSSNRGVGTVIRALRGENEQSLIPHKVAFDENKALLSSRLIAFIMEPKDYENLHIEKAEFLRLLSDIWMSKGGKGAVKDAETWLTYRNSLLDTGTCRNVNLIKAISALFENVEQNFYEGNPINDWNKVRRLLRDSGDARFREVESAVQYLIAFNRGSAISSGLNETWMLNDCYLHARSALDVALTQEQLMSDDNDVSGLHVMTMHKSKGKQFDGVIIFHEENMSPLTMYHDKAPFSKSKKLLRVSVTRASKHVLFLTGVFSPPVILNGFDF